MSVRVKKIQFLPIVLCLLLFLQHTTLALQTGSLTLYTQFTKVVVAPGESIDYAVEIVNKTGGVRSADLSVKGLPEGWNYELKSGTYKIGQISVLPGERKNASLKVDVPLKVDKGTYRFQLVSAEGSVLPLTIEVSEQGTATSEFSSTQPNMQGNSGTTFTYNAVLKNRTGEDQIYSLRADAPKGWNVVFKVSGKAVSSVPVDAGGNKDIMIEAEAPSEAAAGTVKIPVVASSPYTTSTLELEAMITGSYKVELTTPTGLLSQKVTSGREKKIELVVKNIGSSPLSGVELSGATPVNWEVTFEPKKITVIEPGKSETVTAILKADKKALAGDYVVHFDAKGGDTSSRATFRITVEASFFSGFLGVLIILAALASVYYLFKKYGRR